MRLVPPSTKIYNLFSLLELEDALLVEGNVSFLRATVSFLTLVLSFINGCIVCAINKWVESTRAWDCPWVWVWDWDWDWDWVWVWDWV